MNPNAILAVISLFICVISYSKEIRQLISLCYGAKKSCASLSSLFREVSVAVIEYGPPDYDQDSMTPHEYMIHNIEELKELIGDNELDVLVFPEYALTSTEVLDFDNFEEFAQVLPKNDQLQPCSRRNESWSIIDHISCIAFEYKTYLVVNLITK